MPNVELSVPSVLDGLTPIEKQDTLLAKRLRPTATVALTSNTFENEWRSYRDAADSPKTQVPARLVEGARDRFLAILGDVNDAEERENLTALFYAQTRCEWIIQNTRSAYQIAAGTLDRGGYLHCGMLSSLLSTLETCLHPSDTDALSRVLAQPVRRAVVQETTNAVLSNTPDPSMLELAPLSSDTPETLADAAAQITILRDALRTAQTERSLLEKEVAYARKCQAELQDSFGTDDTTRITERFAEVEGRLNALQTVFGGLEETFALANL